MAKKIPPRKPRRVVKKAQGMVIRLTKLELVQENPSQFCSRLRVSVGFAPTSPFPKAVEITPRVIKL